MKVHTFVIMSIMLICAYLYLFPYPLSSSPSLWPSLNLHLTLDPSSPQSRNASMHTAFSIPRTKQIPTTGLANTVVSKNSTVDASAQIASH